MRGMKRRTALWVFTCLLLATHCAKAQQPGSAAAAQVQAGVAALKAGNFAAAGQHFTAALKIDPSLAEVRANLGLAYYAGGQYQQAIPQFREALKQMPSSQTAQAFLPLSLAAVGNCAEAAPNLGREFDSMPNPRLRRVIGLSLLRCQMQLGDSAGATQAAAKLVTGYPNDPDVLYAAGQLYGGLSNQLYARLLSVAPHSARAYQLEGSVAGSEGNWKRAIDAYRRSLKLQPNLQDVHLQIAILLLTHSPDPDAWQQGLQELNEELRVNPSSAQAEYEIGEVYRKHGKLDQAVPAFRRSLELNPQAVPTRLALAKALAQLGKNQDALAALEPAQKTDPNDSSVRFLLAQLYRKLGRMADAQREDDAFRKLRAAAPQVNPEASPK